MGKTTSSLRHALSAFAQDWRKDLAPSWQLALKDVEPACAAVGADLNFSITEPVFPARRAQPLPQARCDAHVFRAFDALGPEDVRCVLLGQDPYPCVTRATGRSFEQGEAADWTSTRVTPSLAGLVSWLAEHRTGDGAFRARGGLRRAMRSDAVALEQPRALFDRWQGAGVLCINTGLTLTRYARGGSPEQLRGHIPFWTPVVQEVLRHLAWHATLPLVFLRASRGRYARQR